ncbi:MAG: ribbon-helix-helix protein, CopG family [Oscillospiraceae bacterium]|nr:ribbon-helix-helix protein, CopG family [Oscillospiraceae bacterium]
MAEKLQISKRSAIKGDDGYKTFSIRIKDETVERLDKIADETNRSRNDIIGLMLDFGINNCEITDGKSE